MITGKQTNLVYFSDKLNTDTRFTAACDVLTGIFRKHGIRHEFLRGTKDIWCRDYMPIQVNKKEFVQFKYEPSYLKDEDWLRTDPREVSVSQIINPIYSDINLDGGNVVNWSDRAIITDRVFDENPGCESPSKLIAKIEALLQAEVIVIPQIKSDMTGHADGLVRFVDRDTILGNCRAQEYKYWSVAINKILKEKGLRYIDVPFLDYKDKKYPLHAIGCYVNYLEIQDLIVLPIFEVKNNKDAEVCNLLRQIFPDRKIETINYNEIGYLGGLLNCTTWTIME